MMTATDRGQRGTGLTELIILVPLLLVCMLGAFDLGRLIHAHQTMTDMTREAGNLVSRGSTIDQTFDAAFLSSGTLDVTSVGGIIISEVRRRSTDDPTPWIFQQERRGALSGIASKVGTSDGPARIPNIAAIPAGVTIMAVETMYPFDPAFDLASLGLSFYPEVLYDAAFF